MSETIIGYARCSTDEQDLTAQRQRLAELGEIGTTFDVFELPGEPGLSICTYCVEEGSPSTDKFALLASWAATQEFGNRHRHRVDLTHDQETAGSALLLIHRVDNDRWALPCSDRRG